MRGMNSETVDLVYLDPPFKKQKPFKSKMTAKTEDRLLEYLRICEGYTDAFGKEHKPRDHDFAEEALEYIGSLRNDRGEIWMEFNDAWNLDGIKASQLEKLKADRVDIYNFINAVPEDDMKAYLIFMAVRILEMHRILKSSGSIYLHCDSTAGAHLKLLMDLIFKSENFKNEITWKYGKVSNANSNKFLRGHDTIYFYAKSTETKFHKTFDTDISPRKQQLIQAGYNTKRMNGEHYLYIYDKEVCDRKGVDYAKFDIVKHVDVTKGNRHTDVFEVNILNTQAQEAIGYPTQKPLALLKRIIEASSDEGDIVFDPFAGCATAIDAAYDLNRRWIACDRSYMSVILLRLRLEGPGLLGKKYPYKYTETKAPVRDDIKEQIDYSYEGIAKRVNVRALYGAEIYARQDGKCAISKRRINYQAGDIDHVIPLADGGPNDIGNLQFISTEEHRKKTARENKKR